MRIDTQRPRASQLNVKFVNILKLEAIMNIKTSLIFLFIIVFICCCSPAKIILPTRGTVIDNTSGSPIAGATVVRTVLISYPTLGGDSTSTLEIQESETDENGKFTFKEGTYLVSPINNGLEYEYSTVAPGYYVDSRNKQSNYLFSKVISLSKLNYYLPLFRYSVGDYSFSLEGNSRQKLEQKMKKFRFVQLSSLGVFNTIEDAKFVKIFANKDKIKAFDAKNLKLYEWNSDGVLIKSIKDDFYIKDRIIENIKSVQEQLEKHMRTNDQISKEEKHIIDELYNIDKTNICCIAEGGKTQYTIIAFNNGKNIVYLVTRHPSRNGRRVYRTTFGEPYKNFYPTKWVPTLNNNRATACDVLWGHTLYVAFEKEGIRKYHLPGAYEGNDKPLNEDHFWMSSKEIYNDEPDISNTFLDIAVGEIKLDNCWGSTPVIYAVNGSNKIFRFGKNGRPDMRIAF